MQTTDTCHITQRSRAAIIANEILETGEIPTRSDVERRFGVSTDKAEIIISAARCIAARRTLGHPSTNGTRHGHLPVDVLATELHRLYQHSRDVITRRYTAMQSMGEQPTVVDSLNGIMVGVCIDTDVTWTIEHDGRTWHVTIPGAVLDGVVSVEAWATDTAAERRRVREFAESLSEQDAAVVLEVLRQRLGH